jgi:hypothetical protein
LTTLTMCSQFFQSCMFSHEHCRFSLLSFSVEIENVNFCDWDWNCDWFWRMITLTCSIVFNLFLTAFLYSRIVFLKWTFFSIVFLHNSIIAKRWSSFSINDQKFLDEHCFEIEKILNIESQNSIFEIFSIRYSDFNLIFKWRLL